MMDLSKFREVSGVRRLESVSWKNRGIRGQRFLKWGFRGLGLLEMARFKGFETEEHK